MPEPPASKTPVPQSKPEPTAAERLTAARDALEAIHLEREALWAEAELAVEKDLARDLDGVPVLDALVRRSSGEAPVREAWGDRVDRSDYVRDDPRFDSPTRVGSARSRPDDRSRGQDRFLFDNELDLALIRGVGRMLHGAFPTAQCALGNLASYVLHTGFTYKASGTDDAPAGLVAAVQAVLDEFQRDNGWLFREEETFQRAHRDGEAFLALFREGERVRLRLIEPDHVTEPQSPETIERWLARWSRRGSRPASWTFGVHSDPVDHERVYGYYVQWEDTGDGWNYVPAEHMLHVKLNVDAAVKRGVSDFYSVQQYLTDVGKLERNVAKGAAILSAIIGVVQHPQGVTQNQVQGMTQSNAWRISTRTAPSGNQTTHYRQRIEPGSWLHTPYGQEYHASPLANQGVGQAVVTIEQALLRTIGSRWSMPEFLISGDASNANYSNTIVAESPWVRFCQRKQTQFGCHYAELFWKVLRITYESGRFAGFGLRSWEHFQSLIDLVVTSPIVQARDRNQETSRRKILHDDGVISAETWAQEEGYDRDEELARGAGRQAGVSILGLAATQNGGTQTVPMPGRDTAESVAGTVQTRADRAAQILWGDYP